MSEQSRALLASSDWSKHHTCTFCQDTGIAWSYMDGCWQWCLCATSKHRQLDEPDAVKIANLTRERLGIA